MPTAPADTTALSLIGTLTAGVSFDIPVVDFSNPVFEIPGDQTAEFYQPVQRIDISEVTTGDINGPGYFDRLMQAMKAHLTVEYEQSRITGSEYTKAYISTIQLAMTSSIELLTRREASFWESQKSQLAAITARAMLAQQKLEASRIQIEAHTAKATYARTVLSLATGEKEYETAAYNLTELLPKQALKLIAENLLLDDQHTFVQAQIANEPKKGKLLDEQTETARAQTMDTRTDGVTPVAGVVLKQKDLYAEQVTSYKRDAEMKAGKLFGDAWIAQKTIDEGLTAPNGFTNASLDQVLTVIKTNLSMNV